MIIDIHHLPHSTPKKKTFCTHTHTHTILILIMLFRIRADHYQKGNTKSDRELFCKAYQAHELSLRWAITFFASTQYGANIKFHVTTIDDVKWTVCSYKKFPHCTKQFVKSLLLLIVRGRRLLWKYELRNVYALKMFTRISFRSWGEISQLKWTDSNSWPTKRCKATNEKLGRSTVNILKYSIRCRWHVSTMLTVHS